jgi:ATP-dependent DNA helicase RecG
MDRNELKQRLTGFEWDDFEVKAARRATPKNAYETVSAFANTRGGHLVFGVEQAAGEFQIVGVIEVDKVQNEFLTGLRSRQKVSVQLETKNDIIDHEGNHVLVFFIPEARRQDKPVYLNGDIRRSFIRRGGGDQRCNEDEIKRFLRNAADDRFDRSVVDRALDRSFDDEAVHWYRNRFRDKNPNARCNDLDDLDFLEHWGLVVDHEGNRHPTSASILLFGTGAATRAIMARPSVDCFWFSRAFDDPQQDERWQDRETFEDNLVQTWRQLLDWYLRRRNVRFSIDPETLERHQQPEDYVSFREAAINLLTHQDYEEQGKKATISFYEDRVVFKNPGPAFEDREFLLRPGDKEVRNPLIVEAFRRIGIGERAGTGLRAIYQDWTRRGRVPPELDSDVPGYEFRLKLLDEPLLSERQILFQASLGVELTEDQAEAMALLCRSQRTTITELSVAMGKSQADVASIGETLITQVLADRVGDRAFRLAPHLRDRWPVEGMPAPIKFPPMARA